MGRKVYPKQSFSEKIGRVPNAIFLEIKYHKFVS